MKTQIRLATLLFSIMLLACTHPYLEARKLDTIEAYQSLINEYPGTIYADAAQEDIQNLKKRRQYLKMRNRLLKEAKKEAKAWNKAKKLNSIESYTTYLNSYSKNSVKAKEFIAKPLSFGVSSFKLTSKLQTFLYEGPKPKKPKQGKVFLIFDLTVTNPNAFRTKLKIKNLNLLVNGVKAKKEGYRLSTEVPLLFSGDLSLIHNNTVTEHWHKLKYMEDDSLSKYEKRSFKYLFIVPDAKHSDYVIVVQGKEYPLRK